MLGWGMLFLHVWGSHAWSAARWQGSGYKWWWSHVCGFWASEQVHLSAIIVNTLTGSVGH